MDKGRLESRRKDFKKNFEDPRRRREDEAVQIRKAAREHGVSQKRAQIVAQTTGASTPSLTISEAVAYAMCDDPEKHMIATSQFRKLLAVDHNPPIQEVIDTGMVPRLITFLKDGSRPNLQLEAAWTLTNIASGTQDQTKIVTDQGAVPIFVELLSSPKEDVRDQAVWALGNIAGDCPDCRDMVLKSGALDPLLHQITESKKISMLRNAAWALSNLCRGSPEPQFSLVQPALPTLRQLVYSTDIEILTDATWALSYLLDTRDPRQIDEIVSAGVCVRLVDLLVHQNPVVQNPALRSVGQIIAGTHQQTEVVIQSGVLTPLLKLLSHPKVPIKKEACWVLSNIAAGTVDQIQSLLTHGFIEPIINLLTAGEMEVKRECAWALSNAVIGGNADQIEFIVAKGCVKALCDLLDVKEQNVVQIALEALECILATGDQAKERMAMSENPYVRLVEEADGCPKLEQLQLSKPESEIYKTVIRILTCFFQTEEDDEFLEEGQAGTSNFVNGETVSNEMGAFGVSMPQGGFNFGGL